MSSKNNKIYAAILALVPDLLDLKTGDYRKFSAAGYMDLHLDILNKSQTGDDNEMLIALSHYYRHPSGDAIPDPDMEIRICPDRSVAEALAYQDIYAYRGVCDESGEVDTKEQAAQNEFLQIWLSNINSQGFTLVERKGDDE